MRYKLIWPIISAVVVFSCNKKTSSKLAMDGDAQSLRAASLQEASSIMDESAAAFDKQGYKSSHSCQDAANVAVRIANRDGVDSRRLDIYCSGGAHAIILMKVQTDNFEMWCPQEPQRSGNSSASNISNNLCTPDFSTTSTKEYASEVCRSTRLGIAYKPAVVHDEGANPEGTLSSPLLACVGGEAYGKKPTSVTECTRCCDMTWNKRPENPIAGSNTWLQQCKWHCEDYLGSSPTSPEDPKYKDTDGDTVIDTKDLCPNTPKGRLVHQSGTWAGCAEGEVPAP